MLETFTKIEKRVGYFTKAICYISFAGIIIIVLLNVADVLMAKTYKPILGTYEITQRLLLCTVFASFAYTQTKKGHINMTILIAKFPRAVRFAFYTLTSILSVFASGALTYAAFYQGGVSMSSNAATEVLYIPLYPFFYVQALAMAAFTIVLLFDAIMSVVAIFKDDVAKYIMDRWT